MPDHVHMCIEIPPKYGEHFWARGYTVSTVGFELEQVRTYIYSWAEKTPTEKGGSQPFHSNRPPLRRSCSSSHRLCRGYLTRSLDVGPAVAAITMNPRRRPEGHSIAPVTFRGRRPHVAIQRPWLRSRHRNAESRYHRHAQCRTTLRQRSSRRPREQPATVDVRMLSIEEFGVAPLGGNTCANHAIITVTYVRN